MGEHRLDRHEAAALDALLQAVEELAPSTDVHALSPDTTAHPWDSWIESVVRTSLTIGNHDATLPVPGQGIEPSQSGPVYKTGWGNQPHDRAGDGGEPWRRAAQ